LAVLGPILKTLARVDTGRLLDRSQSPQIRETEVPYEPPEYVGKRRIQSGDLVKYVFQDEPDRERTARLVDTEAAIDDGAIRCGSPIGRALVGRCEGDQSVLALDGGRRRIIEIRAVQ
jgi:transcription elongation GreA/GreB family factor